MKEQQQSALSCGAISSSKKKSGGKKLPSATQAIFVMMPKIAVGKINDDHVLANWLLY